MLVWLPVILLLPRGRQLSAIGGAVGARLAIDRGFLRFQLRSFAGGQLAAPDTVRDAVLLIFLAFGDGWLRRRRRGGRARSRRTGRSRILAQGYRAQQQHRCGQYRPLRELEAHGLYSPCFLLD